MPAKILERTIRSILFMEKIYIPIIPLPEGNTRTIVTFCSQFIESRGFYIDSDLFKDNAQYMRTALVAASAVFFRFR